MFKKFAWTTIVSTAAFVFLITAFNFFFSDALDRLGGALIEQNEWLALFIVFLVAAVCIVPIPDHAVSVLAWIGGLGTVPNILYSTAGSATGATIAFFLGRYLAKAKIVEKLLARHEEKSKELLVRYGTTGLVIACTTPFPYSPVCWLAGIMGFDLRKFIVLVIVGRAFKVTYVLLFAQQGIAFF